MKGVSLLKQKEKIDEIVYFVTHNPESTASRTILRRFYLSNNAFETSKELGIELKDILKEKNREEIDFCFYLVK